MLSAAPKMPKAEPSKRQRRQTKARATNPSRPKLGRPSNYTTERAAKICDGIANGLSLRELCRNGVAPDKQTVMRWLDQNLDFRDRYARARLAQADHFAEEIIQIADDGSNDWQERHSASGEIKIIADKENVNRSRLRVESRQWLMERMAPKKYGTKVFQEITGADGGPLLIERRMDWASMSDEEIAAVEAFALAVQRRREEEAKTIEHQLSEGEGSS